MSSKTVLSQQDYEFLAVSDTIYTFGMLPCYGFSTAGPEIVVRNVAYPSPEKLQFKVGYHHMYSFLYQEGDSLLEWKYVLKESLQTEPAAMLSLGHDGPSKILGQLFGLSGVGTKLVNIGRLDDNWKQADTTLPFAIGRIFPGHLSSADWESFIMTFSIDTLPPCDTCHYDIDYPPVGFLHCDWREEELNYFVDSTLHFQVEAIATVFGSQSFVYVAEEVPFGWDSKERGALVKYKYDMASHKLSRLYETLIPSFPIGVFSSGRARLYVKGDTITMITDNLFQVFNDTDSSIELVSVDAAPFECEEASFLDVDKDGVDELICAEAIVTDTITQDPNWVIKVYKMTK